MQVGLLISGSLNDVTGGYIYDRRLIDHLRKSGNQVQVIQMPGRTYPHRLLNSFQFAQAARLINLSVDILLQDELDHPALFLLNRKLKSKAGYPVISIVHHLRCSEQRPSWQNRFYRWIERRYLEQVDGFIFNSLTTRHAVEGLIGNSRPAVVANPGGNIVLPQLSRNEIAERAKQSGPLKVLFVGNIIRRKGLHTLLASISQLPENRCQLTVVGDFSRDRHYAAAIRRQLKQSCLEHRTQILGSISDTELASVFTTHHVLAVPSSYEGFGMVYLEGMSYGLPAIGSTSGGAGEIITHGWNGFLVESDDSISLANYLLQLSEDREQLTALSINARQQYESHPTWQQSCDNAVNFIQRLTREKK